MNKQIPAALVCLAALSTGCAGSKSAAPADQKTSAAPATQAPTSQARESAAGCASSESVSLTAMNSLLDKKCIAVPADKAFKVNFTNKDAYEHNFAILPKAGGDHIFKGDLIASTTVAYDAPALKPGTYHFQCDIHPFIMDGDLIVK